MIFYNYIFIIYWKILFIKIKSLKTNIYYLLKLIKQSLKQDLLKTKSNLT